NAPELGEHQRAVIKSSAVAILFVGEGMVAVRAVEPRKARLFAIRYPAEERLVRLVEAGQHILQNVAGNGGRLRAPLPRVLEFGFLLVAREGDAAALPGGDALLQSSVVERATVPEDALQRTLLCGRGPQLLLVGLVARCLFAHVSVFSSGSTKAVDDQDVWL